MWSRLRSELIRPPGLSNRIRLKAELAWRRVRPPIRELSESEFSERHWQGEISGHRLRDIFTEHFLFSHRNLSEYAGYLRKQYPESCRETVEAANRIVDGTFVCFGTERSFESGVPDWHADFISGHRWPLFHIRRAVPSAPTGSDIKIPWEISRCQWGTALGQAFWLTGDRKYAERWCVLVQSWLDNNLCGQGVNWCCSMEVAIRAVNLITGAAFFAGDAAVPDAFWRRLLVSLYSHAAHLERYPERLGKGINTNHLIADYVGLLAISTVFAPFDRSARWQSLALSTLEEEISCQVFPDGGNHEGSTSYHRLVYEMFLFAALLLRKNGVAVSHVYMEKLQQMTTFSSAMCGNGQAPIVGDNDDGFLLKWSTDNPADHRPMIDVAAAVFGWTVCSPLPVSEERLWMLGPASMAKRLVEQAESIHVFPKSGYAIAAGEDCHAVLAAPKALPRATGGHKHNDDLSLTIHAGDHPLLIDSGTGAYTHDLVCRNQSRSVLSHSVLTIDNAESAPILLHEPFLRVGKYSSDIEGFASDRWLVLRGSHDGYNRVPWWATHRREVRVRRQGFLVVIEDFVAGRSTREHVFTIRWLLAAGNLSGGEVATAIVEAFESDNALVPAERAGHWWPRFRQPAPLRVVEFTLARHLPLRVLTVIADHRLTTEERKEILAQQHAGTLTGSLGT